MSDTAMRKSNPFNIGPGVPPPYLAGRQNEQELFNSSLESMAAGGWPSAPMNDITVITQSI